MFEPTTSRKKPSNDAAGLKKIPELCVHRLTGPEGLRSLRVLRPGSLSELLMYCLTVQELNSWRHLQAVVHPGARDLQEVSQVLREPQSSRLSIAAMAVAFLLGCGVPRVLATATHGPPPPRTWWDWRERGLRAGSPWGSSRLPVEVLDRDALVPGARAGEEAVS